MIFRNGNVVNQHGFGATGIGLRVDRIVAIGSLRAGVVETERSHSTRFQSQD